MIAEGLYNLLITTPAVTAFVSDHASPPTFQVYHNALRKGYNLPAIVIVAVTSRPIVTNDGTADLNYQRFQFDCYAANYLDSHRLKDAVKHTLQDFKGTLIDGTVINSAITKMELDNPFEEGKGGFIFRCVIDIQFGFVEP